MCNGRGNGVIRHKRKGKGHNERKTMRSGRNGSKKGILGEKKTLMPGKKNLVNGREKGVKGVCMTAWGRCRRDVMRQIGGKGFNGTNQKNDIMGGKMSLMGGKRA